MTQSDVKEDIRQAPVDDQDRDKFAHYVPKDKLADAMVFGTPLTALCGKLWVPTRDGLKFPICPECQEAYNSLAHD